MIEIIFFCVYFSDTIPVSSTGLHLFCTPICERQVYSSATNSHQEWDSDWQNTDHASERALHIDRYIQFNLTAQLYDLTSTNKHAVHLPLKASLMLSSAH
jgi:hypothetical protein